MVSPAVIRPPGIVLHCSVSYKGNGVSLPSGAGSEGQIPTAHVLCQEAATHGKGASHRGEQSQRLCVASTHLNVHCMLCLTSQIQALIKCLSSLQVWVHPLIQPDGSIQWAADSDSVLVKASSSDLKADPLQLFIFLLLDLPHAVVRPCTDSVQGLAALLVQGLSGCQPQQIVQIPPNFIEKLGLQQSLTPSRNNGFLNMFRMMQRKSLELVQAQDQVRW